MKRYLVLLAILAALGLVLSALGRPRPAVTPRDGPAAAAAAHALRLTLGDGTVTPATSAVPRGARVRLHIEHAGSARVTLALAGYQDRVTIPPLAPGAVWNGEFLADRPGDDFAWLIDGQPAGRLAVTGSHLVEGHR